MQQGARGNTGGKLGEEKFSTGAVPGTHRPFQLHLLLVPSFLWLREQASGNKAAQLLQVVWPSHI